MHTFLETQEVLLMRGQYSILRQVHEDEKGAMRDCMTVVQTHVNEIFKLSTANETNADLIAQAFKDMRLQLSKAETIADELQSLAKQRSALKLSIWG